MFLVSVLLLSFVGIQPINHIISGLGLLGVRVAAGVTTGTLAILAAQPTDVVKVRMQAGGGAARYNGVMDAYSTILRNEVENPTLTKLKCVFWI